MPMAPSAGADKSLCLLLSRFELTLEIQRRTEAECKPGQDSYRTANRGRRRVESGSGHDDEDQRA